MPQWPNLQPEFMTVTELQCALLRAAQCLAARLAPH